MAELFLTEKGNIAPAFRAALSKAGVVLVEVDDLSKCKLVQSTSPLPADDLLFAALDAIDRDGGYKVAQTFVSTVVAMMNAERAGG